MGRIKTALKISLSKEDKEYIINRTYSEGYGTISAYIISCVKNRVKVDVDTNYFYKYVNQVRAIGYNINSIIRDVRTKNFMTALDLHQLEKYMLEVNEIVAKEKKDINNAAKEFEKLTAEEIRDSLRKNKKEIPQKYVYEKLLDDIRNSLLLFINYVDQSDLEEIYSNFIYRWIIDNLDLDNFGYTKLVEFSNQLFKEMNTLTNYLLKPTNKLDEDMYDKVKEILINFVKEK